jgi:hypothetical protein
VVHDVSHDVALLHANPPMHWIGVLGRQEPLLQAGVSMYPFMQLGAPHAAP